MVERRYVWVEDRRGTRLPFSKGILATSLTATGVTPQDSYQVAEAIEDELWGEGRDLFYVDELVERIAAEIGDRLGPDTAATWTAWIQTRRAGYPIIVLMGGATGVGKSTVATRLAGRLGISQVVATDAVREVMRGIFPAEILPTLHVSSFEAHTRARAPVPEDHDPVVAGFRQQAEVVAVGIRKLVERALKEQHDLVLEGVHLIPGMLEEDVERWRNMGAVCRVILAVPDSTEHKAHFLARLEHQGRRPERYLSHFGDIRSIHRYLVLQAEAHSIPIVEVGALDASIKSVLDLVIASVGDLTTAA